MKKYVKRIACGIIAAIMMFGLVGCGGIKSVIVGTWNITESDYGSGGSMIFRDDGTCSLDGDDGEYETDGDFIEVYQDGELEMKGTVEVVSDNNIKIVFNDDGETINVNLTRTSE